MKRTALRELGLKKELVDKVMDLHQKDVERNKKNLVYKNQTIKRIEGQLEETSGYVDSLNKLIKKYEAIDLNELETMKKTLSKKDQEEAKKLLFSKLEKAGRNTIEQAKKEFKVTNFEFEEASKNFIDVDSFIEYVGKLHLRWICLLFQK